MADAGSGRQPVDDDGALLCLECGKAFRLLAPHLAPAHGLTTAAYRERHQLPRKLSLRAADLSARASEQGAARYAARPDIRAHLDAGRLVEGKDRVASSQETARRPLVVDARRRAAQVKKRKARERIDAAAQACGYETIEAYFAARAGRFTTELAVELGIPRPTVRQWRALVSTRDRER